MEREITVGRGYFLNPVPVGFLVRIKLYFYPANQIAMQFLTIRQATTFLEDYPVAYEYIQLLINECIRDKNLLLSKSAFHKEFSYLQAFSLVQSESENTSLLKAFSLVQDESETAFLLNFENLPVCYVLMKVAEDMMRETIPAEPVACMRFINRFAELIRQPEPRTSWYAHLRVQFETYAQVYLHQVHQVDITAFVESITGERRNENTDLMSMDVNYRYVFPYLDDDTGKQFAAISRMLKNESTKYAGLDALSSLGRVNPEKAAALYEFAKARETALLAPLLVELYGRNGDYYLDEAIGLFKVNPLEGLSALTGFNYQNPAHICTASDFVNQQERTDTGYLRMLPAFYVRLIENKNSPEEVVQQCFKKLEALAAYEDVLLRDDLLWRIGKINGRDREKNDLLFKAGSGLLNN